ncbi:MAG: hypothetical protein AB7G37_11915 [Solirubrobacteraceae bacterium]
MSDQAPFGGRGLHGAATIVLSGAIALLGVALLVVTITGGGGVVSRGTLLGVLFVAAGGGRAWIAWRGPVR